MSSFVSREHRPKFPCFCCGQRGFLLKALALLGAQPFLRMEDTPFSSRDVFYTFVIFPRRENRSEVTPVGLATAPPPLSPCVSPRAEDLSPSMPCTQHTAHSTRHMAHGTQHMEHGTWHMEYGMGSTRSPLLPAFGPCALVWCALL